MAMKKIKMIFSILALVLSSLACQTLMGGPSAEENFNPSQPGIPDATVVPQSDQNGNEGSDVESEELPTMPPIPGLDGLDMSGKTDFPVPDDAENLISMGSDIVNFQTKHSLNEMISFYRDEFSTLGYTEREQLTVATDTTFSMVFDGHESGKAITVQGVDLGDGSVNISISLVEL